MYNKTGKITAYISVGLVILQLLITIIVPVFRVIRYGSFAGKAFPIYLTTELIFMLIISGIFCIIVSLKKMSPKALTAIAILFPILYSVSLVIVAFLGSYEYNIARVLGMEFYNLDYLNHIINLISSPFYAASVVLFWFACGHTAMYSRAVQTKEQTGLKNTRSRITAYVALGITLLQFVLFTGICIVQSIRTHGLVLPVARTVEITLAALIIIFFSILISFPSTVGKKEKTISLIFMILYICLLILTSFYLGNLEHRIGVSSRFYDFYSRSLGISRGIYYLMMPLSLARNTLFSYSLGSANMHGKTKLTEN